MRRYRLEKKRSDLYGTFDTNDTRYIREHELINAERQRKINAILANQSMKKQQQEFEAWKNRRTNNIKLQSDELSIGNESSLSNDTQEKQKLQEDLAKRIEELNQQHKRMMQETVTEASVQEPMQIPVVEMPAQAPVTETTVQEVAQQPEQPTMLEQKSTPSNTRTLEFEQNKKTNIETFSPETKALLNESQKLIDPLNQVQKQKMSEQVTSFQQSYDIDQSLESYVMIENSINQNSKLTDEQKQQMRDALWADFDNYVEQNPEQSKSR